MNELKPLSFEEAEIIIDYLTPQSEVIEFKHPILGYLYVEHITYAPFPEPDYKDFVKEVEQEKDAYTSGEFWGHTYRVVVIVEKQSSDRSRFKEPKVFAIQELQQAGILGFEYPESILEENNLDDDEFD